MFGKIEISIARAFFWPVANLVYWGFIFLAWWDTRFKVFWGVSVLTQLTERKSLPDIMHNATELGNRAQVAMAEAGAMQNELLMVPLVVAVILFFAPFVVRRDYGGPVSGPVALPGVTLLCYLFVSVLDMVIVPAMSAGIYFLLFKPQEPDIFMFAIHPLYLIFPLFRSVPGFLSQCLYLVYIGSVLTAAPKVPEVASHAEDADAETLDSVSEPDDDWDKSACLMEMDRLTRILNTKFDSPVFVESLRTDVAEYINRPSQIRGEVKLGLSHYKIVLTETKNSLRRMLEENPGTAKGGEAFCFVVDEMERMEYISEEDAKTLKSSFELNAKEKDDSDQIDGGALPV
jgi:hypothetical protein